jgi:hypothetical protein
MLLGVTAAVCGDTYAGIAELAAELAVARACGAGVR